MEITLKLKPKPILDFYKAFGYFAHEWYMKHKVLFYFDNKAYDKQVERTL